MCAAARCLAVLTLSIGGCATIDAIPMRQMNSAELIEAFGSCVGPYGVHADVSKLSLSQEPELAHSEQIQLSTSGTVSDGFNHDLLLERSRGMAYVLETGGLAGVRKWYGPITLRAGCTKAVLRG